MSKYKIEFKLKQHTPLIHFQAEQFGATLRASELKPKLDKFLIEQLQLSHQYDEKAEHKPKQFFINEEKEALDYKVRIDVKSTQWDEIPTSTGNNNKIPAFFANMGLDYSENKKYLCVSNDPIKVTIHSFHTELINLISLDLLQTFFQQTNFGTRQSKGFGNFSIIGQPLVENYYDVSFDISPRNFPFSERGMPDDFNAWETYFKVFTGIDFFYRSLRSGINRKGRNGDVFYIKPAIFYYSMKVLDKQWDKKSIKEVYYPSELEKQIDRNSNPDILTYPDNDETHIMIKDVFGLSSTESWREPYKSELTKSHDSIDRFQSPLLFKPYEVSKGKYKVYIKSTPIPSEFLGETFKIKFGSKEGLKLKTPDRFLWSDFWSFYFSKDFPVLNERCDTSIDGYARTTEYRTLKRIQDSIRVIKNQNT